MWALSSADFISSSNLDEHLHYLLSWAEPAAAAIRDLLEDPENFGDVFCYLFRDSGHGGPTLSAATLRALAVLGLSLSLDIYGPHESYTGRSGQEIRERHRRILNIALRRPDKYGGQRALLDLVSDLAWMDRRNPELAKVGESFVERSMWTSTGLEGAFERLIPKMDAKAAAASALAEVARRFGWLDRDHELDAGSYWRIVNSTTNLVAERELDLDSVVDACGKPTLVIGGPKGGAVGYAGPDPGQTFVWFHTADADRLVVCVRRGDEPLPDSVSFTQLGESLRDPNPYPTEALRGAPPPFRYAAAPGSA